jgi:hypothetical protein
LPKLERETDLQLPEIRLAADAEDLGDRRALAPFDFPIEVENERFNRAASASPTAVSDSAGRDQG